MTGILIAFEGLDQSGKQTQAERVREYVRTLDRDCRLVSFPDYATAIGGEISRALQGEREYGADVMQLLYVANRYERRVELAALLEQGCVVVCDRYLGSSIAYGEAQGLDLSLLSRVRDSYRRQASTDNWLILDGERPRNVVSADVVSAVEKQLARP
jgi:thymidylate kinase